MSDYTLPKDVLRRQRLLKWRGYGVSWLMVLPALIFLSLFVIYPAVNMGVLSLFKGNATKPYKEFIALDNYHRLFFVKKDFLNALGNTALYALGALVSIMIFSLLLAQWMFKDRRINNIAQTVFFTPHLVAGVSAGFIWSWLMSSQSYGLFNSVLNSLGLPSVRWLDDSSTAMLSIIIMNTWKSIGYYSLIIIGALQSISPSIYEAAALDNSGSIRTMRKITIPMISPQLFFTLIVMTIGSFKVFDTVRLLTDGGPNNATSTIVYYIYKTVFWDNNVGRACAASVILLFCVGVLTFVYFRLLSRKVHYQ